MAAPTPLLCLDPDQPTVILTVAGASVTGNQYAVPPVRGSGGNPPGATVAVTGTGTLSVQMQGTLDGVNWFNLGTAISAAGLTNIANPPSIIRATTGSGNTGSATVTVDLTQ